MDSDSIANRPAHRPAKIAHGVLTIAVLLGVYVTGLHLNGYSIDVVCVSLITGSIALVIGISGVAIGFVIGCLFGRAKLGMYFGAVVALTAVLLPVIALGVLLLFLVVIPASQ